MNARLFFALPLPRHLRASLSELPQRWDSTERERWRWVQPNLLHLTLAFLGQRPDQETASILEAGEEASRSCAPFSLHCRGLGAFPSSRKPTRVLWAGLGQSEALSGLAQALERALLTRAILAPGKPFKAHVTLARRRPGYDRSAPPLPPDWSGHSWGSWTVPELVLFESVLAKGPPAYRRRAAWKLSAK